MSYSLKTQIKWIYSWDVSLFNHTSDLVLILDKDKIELSWVNKFKFTGVLWSKYKCIKCAISVQKSQ